MTNGTISSYLPPTALSGARNESHEPPVRLCPYGDPEFDCPDGCTTYPLGVGTKEKVRDIIDNHIKSDPACAWVKPFLQTSYNYKRIRWYDTYDGDGGDAHWYQGNTSPTQGDIHIWEFMFANTELLGKTLIHEAGHINFDTGDDVMLDAWAAQCYKP